MRILYQKKMSPFCHKVRLVLDEKGLEYHTINKGRTQDADDVRRLDPSGRLPVLLEDDNIIIAHHHAISEYLDETHKIGLLGSTAAAKAEVRRMSFWFDEKFYGEVVKYLLSERLYKRIENSATPNGRVIAIARANLESHLKYLSFILNRYDFLAGGFLSLADLCGVSHLAVLDYLGEVSWDKFKDVKEWYAKIKSRPSFHSILKERMDHVLPPPHYSNLDF